MMDYRGFPIEGAFTQVHEERDMVERAYTDDTVENETEYRYAVQWLVKGATASDPNTYSALSFIYPVKTLPPVFRVRYLRSIQGGTALQFFAEWGAQPPRVRTTASRTGIQQPFFGATRGHC